MHKLIGQKCQVEIIQIFAAVCNEEKNEGRGRQIDNSYHLTEDAALFATEGIDVMGSDGKVEKRTAIKFDDNVIYLCGREVVIDKTTEKTKRESLAKKGLGKLSAAERRALGH